MPDEFCLVTSAKADSLGIVITIRAGKCYNTNSQDFAPTELSHIDILQC